MDGAGRAADFLSLIVSIVLTIQAVTSFSMSDCQNRNAVQPNNL
jgi:divalent metal cation (Fe/Co/Zn/Cd) transporter